MIVATEHSLFRRRHQEDVMAHATLATRPVPTTHPEADAIEHLRDFLVAQRASEAALAIDRDATADALAGQLDPDSILERELAQRSATWARRTVADIDEALARIEDGSYGICDSCARPIPVARLEALPHARTCVRCAVRAAA
jgi:RNA polymerase-binding transcription factor DksA